MLSIIFRVFLGFMLAGAAGLGAVYTYLGWSDGVPASKRPFFKKDDSARPLVIAHRGGAGLFPENTLYAFEQSYKLGVDVLELDVRRTADGALVVLHDATVDRTTDGTGKISEMTLAEAKKLDAGFRFTLDGTNFPLREKEVRIPTLQEVLEALPDARFNIEMKQEGLVEPLCELIRTRKMIDKTVVASFRQTVLDEFRTECREVATSAGPSEVSRFLAMYKSGLGASYSPAMQALQVPENLAGLQVISKEFVTTANRLNLEVHAWTINETADMQRLLSLGVNGIMTDYPDRLLKLLDRTIIIERKN